MNRVEKFFKKNINLLLVITLVLLLPRDLVFAGVESTILEIIHVVLTAIPGAFVYIAGLLLNFSIDYLVIGMGQLITSAPGSTGEFIGLNNAINSVWTLVRDILNIVFIFSLIYLGIKTILYSDDSSTRRSIGLLIIAALLINFSLFITKVIIDFSNVAALQIFNLIDTTHQAESVGENRYYGVSGALLNILGVHTLMGAEDALEQFTGDGSFWAGISYIFMTAIFLLITAVVFAAGAFMLIARFVALIFYMIFSPVMFLGLILPNFKSTADKWWSGLLNKAFFAPAYLFTLYLSIYILQELVGGMNISSSNNMTNAITSANSGGPGAFEVILVFFLAAGMMIGSLIVAQKMGATGATSSLNFLKSAQKNIKGSLQSFAGRNTVGWAAGKIASKIKANEATPEGRRRNFWTTAATLGTFDTQARLKLAEDQKKNTFGGSRSYESQKDWSKKRSALEATGSQTNKTKDSIKAYNKMPDTASDSEREKLLQAMERSVKDAPTAHILEMAKDKDDFKLIESVAGELTDSQWKAIMDDKEINDSDKGSLAKARGVQTESRLVRLNKKDGEDTYLANVIAKADNSELKALGYEKALENAQFLSSKQISDWKDLTPTEKSRLKKARKKQLNTTFDKDGGDKEIFEKRFKTDAERAKLPEEILMDTKATKYMNPKVLAKILDDDGVDANVRKTIKDNIYNKIDLIGPSTEGDSFTDKQIEAFNKFFNSPLGSQF